MQVPLTNHVAAVLDSVPSPKLFLFGGQTMVRGEKDDWAGAAPARCTPNRRVIFANRNLILPNRNLTTDALAHNETIAENMQ